MKVFELRKLGWFALVFSPAVALGQGDPELINVPLSRPGEPVTLEISAPSARIEVIGEDREDAEFELKATGGSRQIVTPSGTQSIPDVGYSLEVDERDNHIEVDMDWRASHLNIVARVPRQADLDLSTVQDGEIIVDGIRGDMRLQNTQGPITAKNVVGNVIAESVNDTVDISISELSDQNVASLSSIAGDLKLGLSQNAGVQLHIDSAHGEIFSDFDVDVRPTRPVVERRDDRGGVEVRVESVIVANINGGGPIIKLKTLNGDIHVRKSED